MADFDSMVPDAAPQAPEELMPGTSPQASPEPTMHFDSMVDDSQSTPARDPHTEALPDFDSLQSDEDKYTTPGQKTVAALEAVGRGVTGPVIPWIERYVGVPPEDIKQREEQNPYTSGAAETAGLLGGAYLGAPLAKVMGVAGEGAVHAAGLADATSFAGRVGSSIVENAAQMAVLQASDEAAKTAYDDAPTSAESVIANIGLAAAIGGAAGGFLTGAVSPLWKATLGNKSEEFLNSVKHHLNGAKPLIDSVVDPAEKRTVELVHYSPKKLTTIDPNFSGGGVDKFTKGRDLEEKISHYYIKDAPRSEADSMVWKGNNEHTVKLDLDKNRIYDYASDPEDIRAKVKEQNGGAFNLDNASKMLKERGYSGFTNSKNVDNPNTIMMFNAMPVDKINGVKVDNLPKHFSMITSQVGDRLDPDVQSELKSKLEGLGYKVSDTSGHYGSTPEPSFMVEHNGTAKDIQTLDQLGKQYNQEAVLHSGETEASPRHNEMHYMNGNKSLTGDGVEMTPDAETNFTQHPSFGKFQLNLGENAKVIPLKVKLKHAAKDTIEEAKNHAAYEAMNTAFDAASDPDSSLGSALSELGIELNPVMKAAMSGEPKAIQLANELREAQHPEVLASFKNLPDQVTESVVKQMKTPLEDAAHYSENEAGRELYGTFEKEYNKRYAPVAKAMEDRDMHASTIRVPDEARRDFGGKIIEKGMNSVGTDSPYYSTYENYAQRVMAKDTVGGLDKLKTEIYNKAKSLSVDNNEKQALYDIRNMITKFQDDHISAEGYRISDNGMQLSPEVKLQRAQANQGYKDFHNMSSELTDNLGVGNFRGAGTLKEKLEGMAPEDLLKKFSPKGNVDSIGFLKKYFPETFNKVQEVESKKFLSSSIYTDQGHPTLDIKKLNRLLERTKKGSPEYADFVMPKDVQKKIHAAQAVLDAIPGIKSSGTAGWMTKMMAHLPASAVSAVGFLMGHNPISGYILGELAQRIGRDVPDAIKLSFLKFLGSGKAVDSAAFKASVDTMDHAMKGQLVIQRAIKNVLKPGSQVATTQSLVANRDKLDDIVDRHANQPTNVMNLTQNSRVGHYLPQHQAELQKAVGNQVNYLQSLKPKPYQLSPLDKPIPPSKAAEARYNRALDIANSPTMVLQHVKDGTIQISDIKDLQALYPSLYSQMAKQLSSEIAQKQHDEEPIPYKTKMGISLFLSMPMDSTMTPEAIRAAQPVPKPQPQQQPMQGRKGKSALSKAPNAYRTPAQSAESDRSNRD